MKPYLLVNGTKQYITISATDVEMSNGTTLQNKLDSIDNDIENIPITKYAYPTKSGNTEWTGSEITPIWSGYNPAVMTMSGDTSGTDVGNYLVTVRLNDIVTTSWVDDSTKNKEIAWSITKRTITPPTVTNTSLTYNTNAQAPTVSTYDSTYVTVTNNSQTTPGNYTTTLALVNKTTCEWSDGTTADKTISWSIAKSNATISATAANVTLDNSTSSSNVAITTNSNGTIVANSTDTGVATVVVNGGVVEITGVAGGTANIIVQVATNSNYNASTTLTIPVTNNMSSSSGSGSGGIVTKIGLLFNGSGFYRVDENLNVISDDNWNPGSVFPFSHIKTVTLEKNLEDPIRGYTYYRDTSDVRELQYLTGLDLPKMYTSAQKVPSINSNAVVWWIEKEQNSSNHLCSATPMNHRWICNMSTQSNCSYYDLGHEDWRTRRDKLWFNIYDAALIRKLMLIYFNTGSSNPTSCNHQMWLTTYNQPAPWLGFNYPFGLNDWLFGMDRIDYKYDNWENNFNGNIRILLPADAPSYGLRKHYNIGTDLDRIDKGIKYTFNIEYLDNTIHMDDLFLELNTNSTSGYANNPPSGCPWTRTTFSGTGCCDGNQKEWGFLGIELASAGSSKGYRMATSYD